MIHKRVKTARGASQAAFFLLFLFIFLRSLDPFSAPANPFLRFDPLILFTHGVLKPALVLPVAAIIILHLLFGRFFCGWVCPLGSLIDGLDFILRPLRKRNPLSLPADTLKRKLADLQLPLFFLGIAAVSLFFIPPVLQFLHPNVWMVRVVSLSVPGILFFVLLLGFSSLTRRLWCTVLCPLGGLYGLCAEVSLFRLSISACSECGLCDRCPTAATRTGTSRVIRNRCILCFDFEHRCPTAGFSYRAGIAAGERVDYGRRRFLKAGALLFAGAAGGAVLSMARGKTDTTLLRPPGVTDEAGFLRRCIRCFNCVRSCPNGIIRITGARAGIESFLTPHLEFENRGCDYYCRVCQEVCPNFAIPLLPLVEKQKTPIGLAAINRRLCVVYAQGTKCIVCEEFCPVPEKAIKTVEMHGSRLLYPVVDRGLCIGCGICEAHCPAEPRAIRVYRKDTA